MSLSRIYKAGQDKPEVVPLRQNLDDYEQTDQELLVFEVTNKDGQPVSARLTASAASRRSRRGAANEAPGEAEQAQSVLDQARTRAEEIEREAYEKGFAQGEKAGRQLGEQKLEINIRSVQQLLTQLGELREKVFEQEQEGLIGLALMVAEKVIHGELQSNEDVILNIAREVLSRTLQGEQMVIRLNPKDVQTFNERGQDLAEIKERFAHLRVQSDAQISRGGCIVTTAEGEIDASVENQLRMIRHEIVGEENQ